MDRLRQALEGLDEALFALEDRLSLDAVQRRESARRQAETARHARAREAEVLGISQKIASRLDKTIAHVEHILTPVKEAS